MAVYQKKTRLWHIWPKYPETQTIPEKARSCGKKPRRDNTEKQPGLVIYRRASALL